MVLPVYNLCACLDCGWIKSIKIPIYWYFTQGNSLNESSIWHLQKGRIIFRKQNTLKMYLQFLVSKYKLL